MQTFDQYKNLLENHIKNLRYDNCPEPLKSAMKYTLELPGKRLRAVLLLAAYHLLEQDFSKALTFATAIEMIHAYSLIHDDLPCMDNDDMRRGKPSNHKVFGEAMALLAGDGLLNYAYEIMLTESLNKNQKGGIKALHCIAKRAGISGMIAGQIQDMNAENAFQNLETLEYIHKHKTADLIIASVLAGLHLANANEEQLQCGEHFGLHLGMAFQIIDDILDYTSKSEILGKTVGKDLSQNKLTWVRLFGLEQAKKDAEMHTKKAKEFIAKAFFNPVFLTKLADDFLRRIK